MSVKKEEHKNEFPSVLYVVRAAGINAVLLTSCDLNDLPVIIAKEGTEVATYELKEVGRVRPLTIYEKSQ